jgi:hypothetical protein
VLFIKLFEHTAPRLIVVGLVNIYEAIISTLDNQMKTSTTVLGRGGG